MSVQLRRVPYLFLLVLAFAAHAGDGRLEINQSCVATGCFPGDTPGFPVQTQAARSYLLTSSLVVPTANTTAITLAERATLDLGGFSIEGVTSCSASPTVCTSTGTGNGVHASGGVAIRNGAIRKMGNAGILGAGATIVEDLLVEQNGGEGISGGDGGSGWVIRKCIVQLNGDDGIGLAYGNAGDGSIVESNVIRRNGGDGVAGADLTITRNAIQANDEFGLRLNFVGSDGGFTENVINGNNGGGSQTIGGVQMGVNVCGGDTTCP
jgi:hypothetical protein